MMRLKRLFTLLGTFTLALSLLLVTLGMKGCPKPSSTSLTGRVVSLFLRFPEVVRTVKPDASPTLFRLLEKGANAYRAVVNNPTLSNWQIANKIWNEEVKPELQRLNNSIINGIILSFEILLDQVEIPASASSGDTPIKLNFKKEDVDKLERQIKDALRK